MLPLAIVTDRARGGSLLAIFLAASSHVRGLLVPHLLPPVREGLLGDGCGPRVPADGRRPVGRSLRRRRRSCCRASGPGRSPRSAWRSAPSACGRSRACHAGLELPDPRAPRAPRRRRRDGPRLRDVHEHRHRRACRPEYAGSASASVNVTQQVGGSIGTALLSTVSIAASAAAEQAFLRATAHDHLPPAAIKIAGDLAQVHGYTTAFWWAAASSSGSVRSRPRSSCRAASGPRRRTPSPTPRRSPSSSRSRLPP